MTPTSPLTAASAVTSAPETGLRTPENTADGRWLYRVLSFAAELRGSLSTYDLYALVASKLPELAGVDDVSIETVVDERRQMTAPAPTANAAARHAVLDAPGEWATFPLTGGTGVVGVLRVDIGERPLSAASRRTLATVAPLVGEAVATAQTIEKLRELSTVDSMTGCATRQEGLERLRAELKRAHRASQQVAVLMLDLDFFKTINDRYGHQCGDLVLASIGRTIMQTLRVSDVRCRWGGEEFLVVLPDTGLDQARRAALTLARRVAGTVTDYELTRIQVTTSIGVTINAPGEDDPEPILVRADAALYRAKADGRNCVRTLLADGASTTSTATSPPPPLPFRDRRNPDRSDRRHPPGPGRRTSDAGPGNDGLPGGHRPGV
jgi:diguanylate cyclase (GGDEF)-like protein